MNYSATDLSRLADELLRVTTYGGMCGKFETRDGSVIEGSTESDVIKHLTSSRDYAAGRQYRFPGIGNGWVFEGAIEAAGFRIVEAKNRRGQTCRVVTL